MTFDLFCHQLACNYCCWTGKLTLLITPQKYKYNTMEASKKICSRRYLHLRWLTRLWRGGDLKKKINLTTTTTKLFNCRFMILPEVIKLTAQTWLFFFFGDWGLAQNNIFIKLWLPADYRVTWSLIIDLMKWTITITFFGVTTWLMFGDESDTI